MSTPNKKQECGQCLYSWQETGECRKDPPVVIQSDESMSPASYWPEVNHDDWCGQWTQWVP